MEKIAVGVVLFGWHSNLIKNMISLTAAKGKKWVFFIHDHTPKAAVQKKIIKEYPGLVRDNRVHMSGGKNRWHSGGMNLLIQKAKKEKCTIFIMASHDASYCTNTFEKMIALFKKQKRVGMVSPLLLQKNNTIDSAGITHIGAGRFVERAAGRARSTRVAQKLLGPTGALGAWRMQALEEAKLKKSEYLDESLHYKNDIDLVLRVASHGWKAAYVKDAVAVHDRAVGKHISRKKRSTFARCSSLAGQLALVERYSAVLPPLKRMAWKSYALMRMGYAVALEQDTLSALT